VNVGDITCVFFFNRRPCFVFVRSALMPVNLLVFWFPSLLMQSVPTLNYIISCVQNPSSLIHCDILVYVTERSVANKAKDLFIMAIYIQRLLVSHSV
jgi:hypothetical protein